MMVRRKSPQVEHVDAVVVGSGFGGAVSAYRLAEAGMSVVVLERGRPYPPGSFARTPAEMSRAFWDPSDGLYGLFDVWTFDGFDSVVSSGLGGGSLIYANVLLRKDERWFVHEEPLPGGGYESWPVSRAELDPHYDTVENMLGATPYPFDRPPYASTSKTRAMRHAADKLRLDWQLPPLAVSFGPKPGAEPGVSLPIVEPAYGNLHGLPRRTCRLIGECDLGCNEGAKNTLDHTYLSAAKHLGADIRTWHEVRAFRPQPQGGYEVTYVRHDPAREGRPTDTSKLPTHTITCDRLVLGAGTYGTTYLLLRNRSELPGISRALGTRFSGNGDLLTFLLCAKESGKTRLLDASRGPVITSAIRVRDAVDGGKATGRGFYVEDAGYPGFVDWLVEPEDLVDHAFRLGKFAFRRLLAFVTRSTDSSLSRELHDLLGSGELSVSSLPLLGMGRDVPDGVMRLRDGRLNCAWTTATSKAYFERVRATMRQIGDVLDAKYADNPMWFRKRIITVHPVGGAPMGRHVGEGVCDPYGEVFGFPGLYVADGAAMPGPVGTNPSLTIAALADRMCTRMLEKGPKTTKAPAGRRPASVSAKAPARPSAGRARTSAVARSAATTSLSFTEEMKGFFAFGETDPKTGHELGRQQDRRIMFHLTITTDDVDRFLDEPDHSARAEGWVESDDLGGRLPVVRGWFNLFVPGGAPNRRLMLYRLHFADKAGNPLTLAGRKDIDDHPLADIWPDTSTLYFRLLVGHVPEGQDNGATISGAGVLNILKRDFARQLTTFHTSGPHGSRAIERFGQFFLGQLWDVYGSDLKAARTG
jgi:cholesterol oxidase